MNFHYRILLALLLGFVASLFLPIAEAARVILLSVLFLYILFNKHVRKGYGAIKFSLLFWCMLAFCAWLVISHLMSDNTHEGLRFLQKRIPLLTFALTLPLLSLTALFWRRLLMGIAIIVSVACLLAIIASFWQYVESGNSAYLYNDSISIHLGQQSIYTSFFVNISIYIFAWFLFFANPKPAAKGWITVTILFLFVASYLLASRNMMLMLYSSVLIFVAYFILHRRKYLEGITLVLGMLMAAFIVYKFFPKTLNRFRELSITGYDYKNNAGEAHYAGQLTADQWNGANFRLAAWPCGWQLFKEHPLLGTGLGDKRDELNRVYREKQFQFAIDTRKNIHNNYLDILYSTGIIGLLLFLAGFCVLPQIQFWRRQNWLAVLLHGTLLLAMITEVYFDRGIGTLIFGFWTCLLLASGLPLSSANDYPPGKAQ